MQKYFNSIAAVLMQKYPTAPIHIQDIAEGFQRPCFYIDCIDDSIEETGADSYRQNYTFQIIYFAATDSRGMIDKVAQNGDYITIQSLLNKPSLKIVGEERYAKITGLSADKREKDIYFTLSLYLYEKRDISAVEYETMGEVDLTNKLFIGG
jgi:hypothetical protein